MKRQADQAEKTIILHQDEIMAALKSIQGSTIFTTACHVIDITRNLLCGCNVVIVNVYLSYDFFITIINPC
jgi:hypothetical protein